MRIRCRKCGLDMEVRPDSVGRKLKCPACSLVFVCQVPRAIVVDGRPEGQADDDLVVLEEVIEEPAEAEDALTSLTGATEPPLPSAPPQPPAKALEEMHQSAPKRVVRANPRQWYVLVGGVPAVALSYQELVRKAAEGEVKPKSKIYYAPQDLTVQAREIPGLFADIDAKRAQQSPAPRPARRPTAAEQAEAAAAAEALDAADSAQGRAAQSPSGAGQPGQADESAQAAALADALDSLEASEQPLAQEPPAEPPQADTSPEVRALADALGEIEKEKH